MYLRVRTVLRQRVVVLRIIAVCVFSKCLGFCNVPSRRSSGFIWVIICVITPKQTWRTRRHEHGHFLFTDSFVCSDWHRTSNNRAWPTGLKFNPRFPYTVNLSYKVSCDGSMFSKVVSCRIESCKFSGSRIRWIAAVMAFPSSRLNESELIAELTPVMISG